MKYIVIFAFVCVGLYFGYNLFTGGDPIHVGWFAQFLYAFFSLSVAFIISQTHMNIGGKE